MSVLACGLNTSQQILRAGPSILCCPSLVSCPSGITAASIAFSHILWKTDSGWQWTGYDIENSQERHIKSSWKICVCESRIAAINDDGSVLVLEKEWRTLHFQKGGTVETLDGNLSKDYTSACDKEEERIDSDRIMKPKLKHAEDENADRKSEEKDFSEVKCTEHENVCKKVKHETFPEKEDLFAEREDFCCHDTENVFFEPTKINFIHVAVEDNTLLAIDQDGVIYCGNIPVPLKVKVSAVAVGKEHSMALTVTGEILTWGNGIRGQLGIGELCQSEKPVPVESLQGVRVTTIACGAWHCAALSDSGDLYMWGWNESGQLGFPYKSESNNSLFNFFKHSCQCPKNGNLHSKQSHQMDIKRGKDEEQLYGDQAAMKGQGEDNEAAQLDKRINIERSQEAINVQASPLLLDFWNEDVIITNVQCGDRHTLYMLDDGSVWSAGMNKYGQLGVGHVDAVREPREVFRWGIRAMFAGGWNSVFITSSKVSS